MLSFTGKTSLNATVFVNSKLLRNSTNLDEGKFLHEFDCLFQVIFSFTSLGKEARKRELKKVNKEIRNVYLVFPALCIVFVIIMGHSQ